VRFEAEHTGKQADGAFAGHRDAALEVRQRCSRHGDALAQLLLGETGVHALLADPPPEAAEVADAARSPFPDATTTLHRDAARPRHCVPVGLVRTSEGMTTRRAFVTGITGQDGSYLAELLLDRGYDVVGLVRRSSTVTFERIAHIQDRITVDTGDLLDQGSLIAALSAHHPHEVYNLAAQSYVGANFTQPVLTGDVTALGVTRLLEAVRIVDPDIRVYQASSSEMFGNAATAPQHESTPVAPRSPYGAAKAYAHFTAVNYRERFGMHVSCGIAFNHESPRRAHEFLTRTVAGAYP
jgi:hypothetical protein